MILKWINETHCAQLVEVHVCNTILMYFFIVSLCHHVIFLCILKLITKMFSLDDDDDRTSGVTEQPDQLEHRVIHVNAPQPVKFFSNRIR